MKLKLHFVAIAAVLFTNLLTGQSIFENAITTTNPNASNPYFTNNIVAANLTASGIARGTGISGQNATARYNASGWTTAVSLDANDCFRFTLTPAPGYEINFTSFAYNAERSNQGPTQFALRSSVDAYATNIGTNSNSGLAVFGQTISLASGSFQNIANSITFQFHGWSSAAAAGTFSINDFIFNGTVTQIAFVDWANINNANATANVGSNTTITANVREAGVTNPVGQGTGITGWIGYSSTNTNPNTASWTWVAATYVSDSGIDDVYSATFGSALPIGTYYFASRFQHNTGTFRYGGYSGTGGGFYSPPTNINGTLTIADTTVDFANLNNPASGAFTTGNNYDVYAQVYEPGVTDAPGQGSGIQAWIGYSSTNTNPNSGSWTWIPATYNAASLAPPNNDEYMVNLGTSIIATPGTYYYASRFRLGAGTYSYGGIISDGNGNFWDGTTYVSGVATVTTPREINVRQLATNIASGGSHAMGSVVSGTSTAAATFTVENLGSFDLALTGTPKILVTGTDAASFVINEATTLTTIPGLGNTTFTVTFSPTSAGAKTAMLTILNDDADESSYTINLTGTATASNVSNIIVKAGYVYPQNIPYINYQEATNITTSATSIEIGQFTIQDGGATVDADNLGTTLTSVTFNVLNFANVRRIAIYDGATEVGEVAGAASVTFPALSLTAADGGTKDFSIRASFNTVVNDNQQIILTVTNTAVLATGSSFTAVNAGGAFTPNASDNNRIEVTADRLSFTGTGAQQPTNQFMYVNMTPAVRVRANDVNANLDLDYTAPVSVTSTGTLVNALSSNAVTGIAQFANVAHSVAATNRTLTATSGLLTAAVSNTFNVLTGSSPTDYFRSNVSLGTWEATGSWQSSASAGGPWNPATLVPSVSAAQIDIRATHLIYTTTAVTADNIIVNGTFEIDDTFILNNGTGDDLIVNVGASFDNYWAISQNAGATILMNGNYWHMTTDLVLPLAYTWGPASTCYIYGLDNATYGVLVNAGQTFQNFIWDNFWQDDFIAINDTNFKVLGNMEVGETGFVNYLVLADAAGTYNNSIGNLIVHDGYFYVSGYNAVVNLSLNELLITLFGSYFHSGGTGTGNVTVAGNVVVEEYGFLCLGESALSPNQKLNITGNLSVLGPDEAGIDLEYDNSVGSGIITVGGNFTSTGAHVFRPSVDFGSSTNNADNAVYIAGNFTKNGANQFSTYSSSPAKGFVFNGSGTPQTLTYNGANSNRTSYVVAPGAYVTMAATGLELGNNNNPQSSFTVQNTGTLDFNTRYIRPASSGVNPRFIAEAGATLITSNPAGFGGTVASGSLQNFGSLGTSGQKVELPNGVNYVFNAGTNTPFPQPTANFGDPRSVTINAGTVVSNMASQLQITNSLAVNNSSIFRLNPVGTNNIRLQNAAMTVAALAQFDNNGENTIINGGTTSTINVSGRFITRHSGGFTDTGSAVPAVPVTLNAGSTVEYGRAGNQVVQGGTAPTYRNVIFSGSGTKTLQSGNPVETLITVAGPVILDVANHTFGTGTTNLTMTGASTYKTGGAGVKPTAGGTYSLAATSTVEFYSPTVATTEVRKLAASVLNYGNIVVSGNDVVNTGTTGIRFHPTGTFTVKNGGIFKLQNPNGFTGTTTSAIHSGVPPATITLEPGSSVEYSHLGNQTISQFSPAYSNLIISGSGLKTLPTASEIVVGEELTVNSATLQIDADRTMTVTEGVLNMGGIIDIKNAGSLVQINDVLNATANNNTGDIKMTRDALSMTRYDFTYWGSPVHDSSNFSLNDLSPDTLIDKYYKWDEVAQTWIMIYDGLETMQPGRGYIVRQSQLIPVGISAGFSALFEGKPNNGTVVRPTMGSTTVEKLNLLGNPYPSAVDAIAFVTNPLNANLGGSLYFWTHNTGPGAPVGGIYNYDAGDYATWNLVGASLPSPGANNNTPSGKIAAGQGFFVAGITDGPATATFNNTMRVRTPGQNSQFFRAASPQETEVAGDIEKYRIWLNITNSAGKFNQNLTGYVAGATLGLDRLFDAKNYSGPSLALYSVIENTKLTIQGRPLPFNIEDKVDLGYKTTVAGSVQIAIDHFDPFFESYTIYLEDKLLNVIHDLKQSPYSFVSAVGTFNDRFVMRYTTEQSLVTDNFEVNDGNFAVTVKDREITVFSLASDITEISIFDLLGRNVYESGKISASSFMIEDVVKNQQPLIVKSTLANGQVISRKIIY